MENAHIHTAGAGANADDAAAPARISVPGRNHVTVFALSSPSSGIPLEWAASAERPGVNLIRRLSDEAVGALAQRVQEFKHSGDIAVASIHWGSNWGYEIPRSHRDFAHRLIDQAGIDVVYGHSSHHVRGIEVYQDKLILYGCGDFLDDYEGIGGHKEFRPDLGAVYLASLERASGRLLRLKMLPTQVRRMCVRHAYPADVQWLQETLNAQGKQFGSHIQLCQDNSLLLQWQV